MDLIRKATILDSKKIYKLVQKTIQKVYPRYYPKGAVNFFSNHHSVEKIQKDIVEGNVYVIEVEDKIIGTVTINENEINRLFVLPKFRHQGYGTKLFEFAERIITEENFSSIKLHASFAAKKMYLSLGYKEIEYRTMETGSKDFLCVDIMEKIINA